MTDTMHSMIFMLFGATSLFLFWLNFRQSRQAQHFGVPSLRMKWSRIDTADERCPPDFARSVYRTNWLITLNTAAFIATIALSHGLRG